MNIEQTTKEISNIIKNYLEALQTDKQLESYKEMMNAFKVSLENMEVELLEEIAS